MKPKSPVSLAVTLTCILLFSSPPAPRPAATSPKTRSSLAALLLQTSEQPRECVGIYFLVRQSPTIPDCASSTPDGTTLQNEADGKNYMLMGDNTVLKTGERLRLKGTLNPEGPGMTSSD